MPSFADPMQQYLVLSLHSAWVRYITQHGEYDLRTSSEKSQARLAPFAA